MSPRVVLCLAFVGCAQCQSVHFQWAQQIGGSQGQAIVGVATDSVGNTYVVGNTASQDFPVKSALQAVPGGSGLFRIDGPAQWQNLSGAGLAAVNALATDPSNPQTLYAVSGPGVFRSRDGGGSWSAAGSFTVSVNALAVDPLTGNVLYAATSGQGILKSTDGGVTWTGINNGLVADQQDGKWYAFGVWIDPRQPSVVFALTDHGLARSSDSGANWQMNPQLTELFNLSGMAFDATTPGVVYVATANNIQKSTDDGVTWSPLPAPQGFDPTVVLLDPVHPGTIYTGGYRGLWKSADGGNTWALEIAAQVFYLVTDSNGTIYFATYNQVFASADGFATKTQLGPTLPAVSALAVLGARLFVGTQGNTNVFVTKLDAQGNTVYATYFGGAAVDQAQAMALDSSGAVYVTGITSSADFPISQAAYAKSGSSFLFKLNTDGSLAYSTYFAPAGTTPTGIAVDAAGDAYISGYTTGNLPVTAGAYQTKLQGTYTCCNIIGPGPPPITNGFLTKFDPSGGSLVFSTYVGTQYVYFVAMALAPNGETVLSGGLSLYRMSADASALLNSTAFPGSVYALMVDAAGQIYVGGSTAALNGQRFPTTTGAFETTPPFVSPLGYSFGFVSRLDSQFNVTASTLLAGEGGDTTLVLAAAPNGNIFAGGTTHSKAFPLRGAAQGSFSSNTSFVAELTPDLTSAVFSTFAGDTRTFDLRALAPTPDGGVVFGGSTVSTIPFYSFFGLYSGVSPGGVQAFVVKAAVQPAMPRIDSVVNAASLLGVALSPGVTFIVSGDGFGADATLLLNGTATPLLAQSETSLTAAVPLDFSAAGAITVVVQSGGSSSNSFLAEFLPTGPGIFSLDGSGVGQAYVLNADGTVNSPGNPAQEGAEITIYATGVGPMTFTQGYAVTDAPAIVSVDGFGAPGIGAVLGPVAGLPGNVYQISVYVPHPAAYASGNPNLANFVMPPTSPITITLNGVSSQYGLTLSIGK